MNWKQHIAFALFFYAVSLGTLHALGALPGHGTIALGALITVFYGLLPDVDTDKSRIHRLLIPGALVLAIGFVAMYAALGEPVYLVLFIALVCAAVASKFLRHRGFTHRLRFGLLLAFPLFFLGPLYFAFALFAFASHLLADMQLSF